MVYDMMIDIRIADARRLSGAGATEAGAAEYDGIYLGEKEYDYC